MQFHCIGHYVRLVKMCYETVGIIFDLFYDPSDTFLRVAGQLGLKSSRPLSQVGPGSTRPESTRPGVFFRAFSYIYVHVAIYGIRFGFCITFRTKSRINIKNY